MDNTANSGAALPSASSPLPGQPILVPSPLEEMKRKVGERTLAEFKVAFGKAWVEFTPAEKELVTAVARDAGWLAIRAAAGEDTRAERRHLDAATANLRVGSFTTAGDAIWGAVWRVLQAALSTALDK